jgi:uncharacterized membrane protein YphA (DoxX/SURF4 family)
VRLGHYRAKSETNERRVATVSAMTASETVPLTDRKPWQPWLATVGRLLLAGVWLVAGFSKITDLSASVRAVRAYRLLPEAAAQIVGNGLPLLELMLGLLLLVGFGVRMVSAVTAALMVVYMSGIASVWARGLRIDCGCFGSGGQLAVGAKPTYGIELLRDACFVVVALLLVKWPTGRLAIDGLLRSGRKEED